MPRHAEIRVVTVRIDGEDAAHADQTMNYIAELLGHMENARFIDDYVEQEWEEED